MSRLGSNRLKLLLLLGHYNFDFLMEFLQFLINCWFNFLALVRHFN